jgi:hypothetical protein
MQKQTDDRRVAVYFRTAKTDVDTPHLENRMQQLLCYAREKSAFVGGPEKILSGLIALSDLSEGGESA